MPRLVPAEPELVAGRRLGRYELLSPLGKGGFASVWLARLVGKAGFEKKVAIKVIKAEHGRDPEFEAMLLDEARLTAALEHPNVARVFELGEDEGSVFLVMEYVQGESLADVRAALRRRGRTIPPEILAFVLADVCAGLHAAHELRGEEGAPLGLVHRDVSPQNILLSYDGFAKLIDFGIAKARHRLAGDTTTGITKGKVVYMAPEQATANAGIDRRADVWAVGAVAYDLLEGRAPFDAPNDLAKVTSLVLGTAPVERFKAKVPPALARVVYKALERRPAARYATAAETRSALLEAIAADGLRGSHEEVAKFLAATLAEETAPVSAATRGARPVRAPRPSLTAETVDLPAGALPAAPSESHEDKVTAIHASAPTPAAAAAEADDAPPRARETGVPSDFVEAPSRFLPQVRGRTRSAAVAVTVLAAAVLVAVVVMRSAPTAATAPDRTPPTAPSDRAAAAEARPPSTADTAATPTPTAPTSASAAETAAVDIELGAEQAARTAGATPARRPVAAHAPAVTGRASAPSRTSAPAPAVRKPRAHVSYDDEIQ